MSGSGPRRWLPRLVVAIVAAYLVGMAVLGILADHESRHRTETGAVVLPPGQGPLPFGVRASPGVAASKLSFHLSLPNVPLADSSNLTESWVDGVDQQFAATYSTGVTLMLKPNEYATPDTALADAADQINAKVGIVRLTSGNALVIEPDTDSTDGLNPAWVEFVTSSGVDVNLLSATLGTAQLLDVAKSIESSG